MTTNAPTSCFTPEALTAFLEERALPMPRREVVEHVASCGACRQQLSAGNSAAEAPLMMATAFLTAGARTVVATTMDVDDDTTKRLFERFYRDYRDDMAAADALRNAQLDLLHDPRFSAPRHWAPFTFMGNSVGLDLK